MSSSFSQGEDSLKLNDNFDGHMLLIREVRPKEETLKFSIIFKKKKKKDIFKRTQIKKEKNAFSITSPNKIFLA